MTYALTTATSTAPRVFSRDGKVFATSKDVAEFFGKRHDHVLRAISVLLVDDPEAFPNFGEGYYTLPETGRQRHRMFEMDRDGFALLTMGFTGAKAAVFKRAYIKEFNRMEAALNAPPAPALPDFTNPAIAARAWAEQFEARQIEAEGRQVAETKLIEAQPKADAYDLLTDLDGLLTFTATAKVLGVPPRKSFTKTLRGAGVVYPTGRYGDLVPAERYRRAGYFVVKTWERYGVLRYQTLVTPKGVAWLATRIGRFLGETGH